MEFFLYLSSSVIAVLMNMINALCVAIGGALGCLARHFSGVLFSTAVSFPYAILFVNLVGSFLIGFLAGLWEGNGPWAKLPFKEFWVVGFLGGFTTFSSFSLETLNLLESHRVFLGILNITASVLGCLVATWLGLRIGSRMAHI